MPRTWEEIEDPGLRQVGFDEVDDLLATRGDPAEVLAGGPGRRG